MSVAELKLAAIAEINKLNDENAVKEILQHLAKISQELEQPFNDDAFFNKASSKYDDVLKKLAK